MLKYVLKSRLKGDLKLVMHVFAWTLMLWVVKLALGQEVPSFLYQLAVAAGASSVVAMVLLMRNLLDAS